jgi:uncharacterized SAM-binding protein YcdF (DUF218 family)
MLEVDGSMSSAYHAMLDKAFELTEKEKIDLIIICGGETRKGFPSEALEGYRYLMGRRVNAPIVLEERSTSFAENVRYSCEKYPHAFFGKVYVLARKTAMRRLKFLYGRFWPEAAAVAQYVPMPHSQNLFRRFMEYILYGLARVDPEEKYVLHYMKILIRNKKGN